MTRDDIIRMAHKAGFSDIIKKGVWITDGCWDEELERFAELVAAAEREACCAIVYGQCESDNVAQRTVDAIRARGKK
jgi:hypothetical protein